jgi:hypothetical protein
MSIFNCIALSGGQTILMKRLALLLILAGFFLNFSSGMVAAAHVKQPIRAYVQSCSSISTYFAANKLSNKWDVAEKPSAIPSSYAIRCESFLRNLVPADGLSPAFQKQSYWLGMGCGGLPA